jgi:hypothetical protein
LVGFFVFSAGGGALIGYIRAYDLDGLFLVGLSVAYVGGILAALCIAILNTPSLPFIEIYAQVGADNNCSISPDRTFVKLSESEHYWHVYNKDALFVLPVEEVKEARYLDCPHFENRA